MDKLPDHAEFETTANTILSRTNHRPRLAMILGSGLGPLADVIEDPNIIPYSDLPHWPRSTAPGHSGRLVIGRLQGKTILVMQGRIHYYEGYHINQVTFPIRVMNYVGIDTLFVTNAAGGLNPDFKAGDLMLITDHINFLGMGGANPLIGPNHDMLGVRFPNMNRAYDSGLQALARQAAADAEVELREGVYIGIAGPSFETPAEVRMLRAWGGDAVGMSTVSEVTVARHMQMQVMGLSSITNVAIDTNASEAAPNHEEVLEVGQSIVPRAIQILRGVLSAL